MRLLLPLLAVTLGACTRGPDSPFVRITASDGRVYYARADRTIHSAAGGFLAFSDLVTREEVRLKNGTYRAAECPPSEVEERQRAYIDDPTKKPMATDDTPDRG